MADNAESMEITAQPPGMAGGSADVLRVGALGANAWLVISLIPFLWLDEQPGRAWWTIAIVPLVLAVGLWLLRRSQAIARWMLLAGVPIALAAAAATVPSWPARPMEHAAVAVLGAVALWAYGAATARACSMPVGSRPRAASPLPATYGEDPRARGRAQMRAAVLGVTATGALAIAVVAPTWLHPEVTRHDWGRAAPEAAVLTTVAAGALAAVVMGLFVAPAMRRRRHPVRRTGPLALRVTLLLLLALTGAYAYRLAG
jgi:hypothetical protein